MKTFAERLEEFRTEVTEDIKILIEKDCDKVEFKYDEDTVTGLPYEYIDGKYDSRAHYCISVDKEGGFFIDNEEEGAVENGVHIEFEHMSTDTLVTLQERL